MLGSPSINILLATAEIKLLSYLFVRQNFKGEGSSKTMYAKVWYKRRGAGDPHKGTSARIHC